MNSQVMANLILIFSGCILISVFYWEVFHPIMMRAVRFRLFSLRDDVRRIAHEQGLGGEWVHQDIEKFICKTICFGPHISLASFGYFILKHHSKINDAEDEYNRFQKEAPAEFIAIREATAKSMITLMMVNSPLVVLIGSAPIPIMWALGKFSKARIYGGAEQFVEEIESDSECIPSPC